MKKFLIVKQEGYKDCGAASLLSIIRYYHGNISINRLIDLTNTDKKGTTFYNIKQASEELGLEAIGYKVEQLDELRKVKKPFICQLLTNNYEHFVVVYEIKKNKVLMMDPAIGIRVITTEEFQKLWTKYVMVFQPIKKLLFYKEKNYLNKILIETIKENKGIVFNILLLSIIFIICSFVFSLYFQINLNYSIDKLNNNALVFLFVFGILLLLKCITSFFRNELLIYFNEKIDCNILLNTFQKILLLPYNYYKNKTTGEVVSRINDLILIKNVLNKIILTVFLDLILFISCGIFLFRINHIMFYILVIVIMIYMTIIYIFRPMLNKYININQENSARLNSFLIETITGFETIKNINLESIVYDKLENIYINSLNDNYMYNNICNLEMFIQEITSLIGILLVEFLGFSFVVNSQMTIGELVTFIILTDYFIEPIKNIIDVSKEYYYAKNSLKRINNLLDITEENLNKSQFNSIIGEIRLNQLTFSYNQNINILKSINLIIKPQSRTIFLGKSGSGKSTILKLLMKYYEVGRDQIYIDNLDLNDYSLSDIREQISLISQNEILYSDTIENNIKMYRNISNHEFIQVCRITHVDDFAKKLFLGYKTRLEENGLNLSGGQRQRIILARMLLKSSKIILIDEGLNELDINLERKILKEIFTKYKALTFIIISHRIENIDLFDNVVRIEDGYLKENIRKCQENIFDR